MESGSETRDKDITAREARVQRTLLCSIFEGICASVMVGAGETYFVPYALSLGSSNLTLGFFVAFPIFIGSLSQIFSEGLLRLLGSRKRVILVSIGLQALTFLPMMLVHRMDSAYRPELLLAVICVYWSCGLILGPSWSSLMGDLVPESTRGAYFGRRNRFIQIFTFLSIVVSGAVLYYLKREGAEYYGFVVVFALAAGARLISFILFLFHWDPPMESPPTRRTMGGALDALTNPDQRLLVFYLSFMNFSVYVAAPFFSAYMLRSPSEHGLEWSYITFTAVNGITVFFKFVFLPLWGAASDRFGSRKCLVLAAWLICGLPLVWLFPHTNMGVYLTLICITQAWGGLAWAGHELCSFSFLLDSAQAADRPRLVASMNIVNGIMIFLGSMAGSIVVATASQGTNPFLLVFLLSGLSRFAVCALFARRLREIRVVEKISYRSLFFRISSVRSTMGPVMRFFVLPLKKTDEVEPASTPSPPAGVSSR